MASRGREALGIQVMAKRSNIIYQTPWRRLTWKNWKSWINRMQLINTQRSIKPRKLIVLFVSNLSKNKSSYIQAQGMLGNENILNFLRPFTGITTS
jgi:hypothetical protein